LGTDKRGLWKEILDSKYNGWRSLREDGKLVGALFGGKI